MDIPEKIDSTFRFVLLVAGRAEQIMQGARPKVEPEAGDKPTRIAIKEVLGDKIAWNYGPPEVEEPFEDIEEAAEEGETAAEAEAEAEEE